MESRIGLDTNILLRSAHIRHPDSAPTRWAMRRLLDDGAEFCYTPQTVGEFWNVSTRPTNRNGFGLSTQETLTTLSRIESTMTLLLDDARVYAVWRHLLIRHNVHGVQVHDAHLAASLEVHDVPLLLTLNHADFNRYERLTTLDPLEIARIDR